METIELIESLLLSLSSSTDSLGVPLLKEQMQTIWSEQQHVACLQDPPGIQLYTITGYICKCGVRLPVLRHARRSNSLECFHLYLARFKPGTCANAVNFQAYLLDGITRWNTARASAAIQCQDQDEQFRTFDFHLQERLNHLSETIHGK